MRSRHASLCVATMHEGTVPLWLSDSPDTLASGRTSQHALCEMYILVTLLRSGISIGGSGGRASAVFWNTTIIDVVSGIGLEIPRCAFDPAHEFCVPLLVFRKPVDCAPPLCIQESEPRILMFLARYQRTLRIDESNPACSLCDCPSASSKRPSLQTIASCCLVSCF